jgi:hypothetical protein
MAYTSNADATPVFTIPPPKADPTMATAPPAKMDATERSKISAAAHRAKRLFPGPVGELLYREIDVYAQFGWRMDQSGLMPRLVDHIMAALEESA